MWKTITDTKVWTDKLIVWFHELQDRELTFGVYNDICSDEIAVNTDYGECKLKILEEDVALLNFMLGRAGQYGEDSNKSLANLFTQGSKKLSVEISVDWEQITNLGFPCVIPSCCKKFTITNGGFDINKKIGIVLLNRCELDLKGVSYISELNLFTKSRHGISLKEVFQNLYIDKLSIRGVWAKFNGCYIKELHTTYEAILSNSTFFKSFAESCKILSVLDYEKLQHGELESYYKKLVDSLRYLHQGVRNYNYQYRDLLHMASVIKAGSEDVSFKKDIWYIYVVLYDIGSFELIKDDIIDKVSYALKIKDRSNFNLDYIEQNVIIVKTELGIKVQFIFTIMQETEIVELLLNNEEKKYE